MELVKALDDQKAACHALEETVTRYRKLLSESESTLEKQEKRILDASAALQSKEVCPFSLLPSTFFWGGG